MSEGVIPDSDPPPPLLDAVRSDWVQLGLPYDFHDEKTIQHWTSTEHEALARGRQDSKFSETLCREELEAIGSSPLRPSSPRSTDYLPADAPRLSKLEQRSSAQESPTAPSPEQENIAADVHDSHLLPSQIPRRKRFNFETWVRFEKRAHEKVYHRRYAVFHGANSDSEDEDYGLMDGELVAEEDPEVRDSDRLAEPDYADSNSEDAETEVADDERDARRKKQPDRSRSYAIDSESDSDTPESESESILSGNFVVPDFQRKLTKSIPASRRLNTVAAVDSQSDSQPDSQPDLQLASQQNSLESLGGMLEHDYRAGLPQDLPQPADVQSVAPIDFMLSRRPRTNKNKPSDSHIKLGSDYAPVSVSDIALKAGKAATKALRVAVRTAKRTARSGNGRVRVDTPLKKVFAGYESKEAVKTLQRWRQGTLGVMRKPEAPSSRANDSSNAGDRWDALRHAASRKSSTLTPSMSVNSFVSKTSKKRKRQGAPRRRNPEPSPNLFHTTILERQLPPRLPTSMGVLSRKPQAKRATPPAPRPATANPTTCQRSKFQPGQSGELRVAIGSPALRFESRRFDRATFIGSNVLDMLSSLTIWNGENVGSQSFGTPLASGDESDVTRDVEYILALCEGGRGKVDDVLFHRIYNYFLDGTAFLCDESQIVASDFRKHVYRQWLRLARALLKLSLKERYRMTDVPLLSQLASLATAIVAKRLSIVAEVDFHKASALVAWTVYYHQCHISSQIDHQFRTQSRQCVGGELVYAGVRLSCFDNLASVFSKHNQASAKWHMLALLSSFQPPGWSDWTLARALVSPKPLDIEVLQPEDVRVATEYIVRLLTKWLWPPSAEIVFDLFNFYAKQQHYADPRGESIWLPDFLLKDDFDGSHHIDQDFSKFLELLGCTLKLFRHDEAVCRRIAGRVTPLSAVTFPETQEVSLADLSSASHQYSILIVLLRMCPSKSRPSVAQFRDLVVLKDAHLAIRVKAVSAWSIVSRLALDDSSAVECQKWLANDILRDSTPPPPLLLVSLRSAADVAPVSPPAVPVDFLFRIGIRCLDNNTRLAAWDLLARLRPSHRREHLARLSSYGGNFDHLDESDIAAFAKLARAQPDLVDTWPHAESRTAVMATLINDRAVSLSNTYTQSYILRSLLRAQWTEADRVLLTAATLDASSEVGDRQIALRRMLGRPITRDLADLVLETAKGEWASIKRDDAVRMAYKVVVVQARQLVFEQWPDLREKNNTWFNDAETRGIELAQVNINKFLVGGENSAGEFFFAYKLRRSLETDDGQSLSNEIVAALNLADDETAARSFNFVVNHLFAFYFRVASHHFSVMEPALPTLLRTAQLALCQAGFLRLDPTPMVLDCVACLYYVLSKGTVYGQDSLMPTVTELYKLSYIWLQQSGAKFETGKEENLIAPGLPVKLAHCSHKGLPSTQRELATGAHQLHFDDLMSSLWRFGHDFERPDHRWLSEFAILDTGAGKRLFDMAAVTGALKGVNRVALQDRDERSRRFKRSWLAFDRLALCYMRNRRERESGNGRNRKDKYTDIFLHDSSHWPSSLRSEP